MPTESRPMYISSGRFNPSDVLVGGLTLVGVGLILASILAWLVRQNSYAAGEEWVAFALVSGLLVRHIVASSKTRNCLVGCGLGLLAGTISVAGMYHIDQCTRWEIDWDQIDRLPGYITFRMETDEWLDHGRRKIVIPMPAQAGINPWLPPDVKWNWHWAAFLGEIGILILFPATLGFQRARRPFSEPLGDWFTHEALTLTPQSASGLREGMTAGTVSEWVASGVEKTGVREKHTRLAVWYCPRPDLTEPGDSAVYVAFGDGPLFLLDPEEAAVLTGIVPGLAQLAIPDVTTYDTDSIGSIDPTLARLMMIPGPFVGRSRKPSVIWWGRLKMIGMALVPFPVAAGLIGLMFLLGEFAKDGGLPIWVHMILGCVGGGGAMLFVGRWLSDVDSPVFRMLVRHYHQVVIKQAARRPDTLFPPTHPQAMYARMRPRRVWTDPFGREGESEAGLLLLDTDQRQLLFEGDRYRYVIPAASILRCEVEEVTQTQSTAGFYGLSAKYADGSCRLSSDSRLEVLAN